MALRCAIIAASLFLTAPTLAFANDVNSQAMQLAGEKRFSEALSLLSQQGQADQLTYEHRFLKARILSWDGQHQSAREEINSLMADHPQNPDLHLSLGNLEYYQGNFEEAENQYRWVLARYPDYTDAQNGLANVQRAQTSPSFKNIKKAWRIDGGLGLSDFDLSDIQKWDDQFLRAEYSPGSLSYHGMIQRFKRFGSTDIEFRAGVGDAIRGGWDWGVELAVTPNADFRPDHSIGGRLGHEIETKSGLVLYPSLNIRHDEYSLRNIQTIQPDLTAYLANGTILSGRLIGTFQDQERDQLGWLVEGRHSLTEQLQIRLGYARAPEAIDGLAITTESLFGGLTYSVSEDLDLHFNLSRDDREESFVRDSANVSFTYKH